MENTLYRKHYCNVKSIASVSCKQWHQLLQQLNTPTLLQKGLLFIDRLYLLQYYPNLPKLRKFWCWWELMALAP